MKNVSDAVENDATSLLLEVAQILAAGVLRLRQRRRLVEIGFEWQEEPFRVLRSDHLDLSDKTGLSVHTG